MLCIRVLHIIKQVINNNKNTNPFYEIPLINYAYHYLNYYSNYIIVTMYKYYHSGIDTSYNLKLEIFHSRYYYAVCAISVSN